jgi:hypothetical protein
MKRNIITLTSFAIVIVALALSCKKNKKLKPKCDGSNLTFNSGIKAIISNNCTASTCHPAGSPYGNFTTYQGLQPYIQNGLFKRDVLDLQIMPKNKKLSQDDLNKIQCWVDNGYPEN